jgi:hypothetical protein
VPQLDLSPPGIAIRLGFIDSERRAQVRSTRSGAGMEQGK